MRAEDRKEEKESQNEVTTKPPMRTNIPLEGGFGAIRPTKRIVDGHTKPCEECGDTNWKSDNSRGEVSCDSCGLVVEEDTIDPGADWTNHANSTGDKSRVGAPSTYLLADRGLNSHIAHSDLTTGAASRFGMSSRARREWRRRRVIDERSQVRKSRQRNVIKAIELIRNRSKLGKQLQEEAARLYSKLSMRGYVTGRSIAGVSAACVYLVARLENIPQQIKDVSNNFQVEEKELSRMIRQISRKMKLQKVVTPNTYFNKFRSDLQLPPKTVIAMENIWEKIKDRTELWQGRKPNGIAAAILYYAVNKTANKRTQADICKVAGVSEVTLRGIIRQLDLVL